MLMHTAALARVQMASLQLHVVAVCTRRVASYCSGVPFVFHLHRCIKLSAALMRQSRTQRLTDIRLANIVGEKAAAGVVSRAPIKLHAVETAQVDDERDSAALLR